MSSKPGGSSCAHSAYYTPSRRAYNPLEVLPIDHLSQYSESSQTTQTGTLNLPASRTLFHKMFVVEWRDQPHEFTYWVCHSDVFELIYLPFASTHPFLASGVQCVFFRSGSAISCFAPGKVNLVLDFRWFSILSTLVLILLTHQW